MEKKVVNKHFVIFFVNEMNTDAAFKTVGISGSFGGLELMV